MNGHVEDDRGGQANRQEHVEQRLGDGATGAVHPPDEDDDQRRRRVEQPRGGARLREDARAGADDAERADERVLGIAVGESDQVRLVEAPDDGRRDRGRAQPDPRAGPRSPRQQPAHRRALAIPRHRDHRGRHRAGGAQGDGRIVRAEHVAEGLPVDAQGVDERVAQAVEHRQAVQRGHRGAEREDAAAVAPPGLEHPPDAYAEERDEGGQVQEPGDADEEHQRHRRGREGQEGGDGRRRSGVPHAPERPRQVVEAHRREAQGDDLRRREPAEVGVQRVDRQQQARRQHRRPRTGQLERQQAEPEHAQQAEERQRVEAGTVAEEFGERRHPDRMQVVELKDVLAVVPVEDARLHREADGRPGPQLGLVDLSRRVRQHFRQPVVDEHGTLPLQVARHGDVDPLVLAAVHGAEGLGAEQQGRENHQRQNR